MLYYAKQFFIFLFIYSYFFIFFFVTKIIISLLIIILKQDFNKEFDNESKGKIINFKSIIQNLKKKFLSKFFFNINSIFLTIFGFI